MNRVIVALIITSAANYSIYATPELDQQMKGFAGRVRIYSKCIRRKCSQEERTAAAQTILKDGRNLLLTVGALFLAKQYVLPVVAQYSNKKAKKTKKKPNHVELQKIINNALPFKLHKEVKFTILEEGQTNSEYLGYELESTITLPEGMNYPPTPYEGSRDHWASCLIRVDENNWLTLKVFYRTAKAAEGFKVNEMDQMLNRAHHFIPDATIIVDSQ